MLNKNNKEEEKLSNVNNIIGKGTTVTGNVETYGNIRIEGKVVGDIKTKTKATTGPDSSIDGSVLAQNAQIEGHVSGTVEITELLVLKATATVEGDIITNKLLVESGATFNGKCKMGVKNKEISLGQPKAAKAANG